MIEQLTNQLTKQAPSLTGNGQVFTEEKLQSCFKQLLEQMAFVVISSFNRDLPFQNRFTIYISKDMVQCIEYKSFEVSTAWAKKWGEDNVFKNKERIGQEALIPFFEQLEKNVNKALSKDTIVFKPIAAFKKEPSKQEEFQQIVNEDIERFPLHIEPEYAVSNDFKTMQTVALSLGKARVLLKNRPKTTRELTHYLKTDHVTYFSQPRISYEHNKKSLENMDIRLLSGIRTSSEDIPQNQVVIEKKAPKKDLKQLVKDFNENPSVAISNDMDNDEKKAILYDYYRKIHAKDFLHDKHVSLFELLSLIKACFLSWPRVEEPIHKLIRNAIKIYSKSVEYSVVIEECEKAGWLTPQSIHAFFCDFEYLAEKGFYLEGKNKGKQSPNLSQTLPDEELSEQAINFLKIWGGTLLRNEDQLRAPAKNTNLTIKKLGLIEIVYKAKFVDDIHKFKPWKRQFMQTASGKIIKNMDLSRLLLKINKSTDDVLNHSNNPDELLTIRTLKDMVYILEKEHLMKFSSKDFDNYMKSLNQSLPKLGENTIDSPEINKGQDYIKLIASRFAEVFNRLSQRLNRGGNNYARNTSTTRVKSTTTTVSI